MLKTFLISESKIAKELFNFKNFPTDDILGDEILLLDLQLNFHI